MNLVVDYGNSAAKVGIFDHQNLVENRAFESLESLQRFVSTSAVDAILISSVKEDPEKILAQSKAEKKFVLTPDLPLPIQNKYATPRTLGMDRIASACGAWALFPRENSLSIDAGTCITYEVLDKNGNYRGGAISPGLSMRFKAVHTFTAKLPLISPKENVPLIGDSTETSIQSGVINGLVAEIEGFISRYQKEFGSLRVILCGGDARFFENQLKASIFASPELVLIGLNSILNYNVTR
ncbi:MAG TPA: type III pantothenate kinase [Sphingobacteriaceae bacterium]